MPYVFLILSTVLASTDLSVDSILKSLKPDNVIFEFDEKTPPFEGRLVTFVTGVGHAPFHVELTTIRQDTDKVKVVQWLYTRSGNKETPRFKDFNYEIKEGEMSSSQFKNLMDQLSKIHTMKTYKAYETIPDDPFGFKGERKTHGVGHGRGFSSSSANYAHLVNVWGEQNEGFLYAFSGYDGEDAKEKALKVNAMSMAIKNVLSKVNLSAVKEVLPEHKDFFQHQLTVVKARSAVEKDWGWVKQRTLALQQAVDAAVVRK